MDRKIGQKKRLLQAFEYLKQQGRVTYYTDVARAMQRNNVTVRGAFSEKSQYLPEEFLHDFLTAYAGTFSEKWLLEGEGNMLLPSAALFRDQLPKEPWQRVQEVMEREGMSITEFSAAIGVSFSTISRIFQRRSRPKDRTLEKILTRFPYISRPWLYHGEGDAIKADLPSQEKEIESNADFYIPQHSIEVKIIPDAAAAGTLSGYAESVTDNLPTFSFPTDKAYKGDYYQFSVRGASMDDGTINAIADGNKVIGRKVEKEYWSQGLHIRTWPYFVIITEEDGLLVKSIVEQDLEAGTILCRSLNSDYPDITLHLSEVKALFNVVYVIRDDLKM